MANRKISDLTALTTPASGDYLPIVDISEAADADKNKRITIEELMRGAPDGTAAAPSFAFESDGGNGFYLAGTDTIGASTNGVNRLTLSTSALTSTVPISATGFIPTSSTIPTNGLYLPSTNSVALSTNGTGRLFVDASGNVGVGVASAGKRLDVSGGDIRFYNDGSNINVSINRQGNGIFNPTLTIWSAYNATYPMHEWGSDVFGNYYKYLGSFGLRFIDSATSTERARIDSSGRLLVGTSSDSGGALLQVNGDRVRIATAKTPASASDTGTAGEVCWDTNYIYVCTATNTWKRAALSTW